MSDVTKWTKKVVLGINEQGQVDAAFQPTVGEVITPREVNLYKKALQRGYFIHNRSVMLKNRLAADKLSAEKSVAPVK